MDVNRKADIRAFFGATGTGKSHEMKRCLRELVRTVPRVLIIDPDGEYSEHGREVATLSELYTAAQAPAFALRFRPNIEHGRDQFDAVCRIAWDVAERLNRSIVFVVDELAEYTTAADSGCSPAWLTLIKRGRKHGVVILAASQRPADINKGLFDNATLIRSGWLNNPDSQARIAKALGVPIAQVEQLEGRAYLERDRESRNVHQSEPDTARKPENGKNPAGRPAGKRSTRGRRAK